LTDRREIWQFYTFRPSERAFDRQNLKKNKIQHGGGSHQEQEGQHPLTGQRAANFRLLANQ